MYAFHSVYVQSVCPSPIQMGYRVVGLPPRADKPHDHRRSAEHGHQPRFAGYVLLRRSRVLSSSAKMGSHMSRSLSLGKSVKVCTKQSSLEFSKERPLLLEIVTTSYAPLFPARQRPDNHDAFQIRSFDRLHCNSKAQYSRYCRHWRRHRGFVSSDRTHPSRAQSRGV